MTANRIVTIWGASHGGNPATRWLVGLPNGRDLCPRHHHQRTADTFWGGVDTIPPLADRAARADGEAGGGEAG